MSLPGTTVSGPDGRRHILAKTLNLKYNAH